MDISKVNLFVSRGWYARWLARSLLVTTAVLMLGLASTTRADILITETGSAVVEDEGSCGVTCDAGPFTLAPSSAANDELGTWAMVVPTPMPEPPSSSLLVIGVLGLAAGEWGRRRFFRRHAIGVPRG